jgi:hypothetical protein
MFVSAAIPIATPMTMLAESACLLMWPSQREKRACPLGPQQLRQLSNIHCNAPCLIEGQHPISDAEHGHSIASAIRVDQLDVVELTPEPSNFVLKEFNPLPESYERPE